LLIQSHPYICQVKCKQIVKRGRANGRKNQQLTVAYDNNDKKMDSVYSKRIRAGKRRTYFFDVRSTRGNDYYLTITESRKRFNDDGYDRHKIFLYKEDFNKFIKGLGEAVDFVKTELMPNFDFDAFNHEYPEGEGDHEHVGVAPAELKSVGATVEEPISEPVVEEEPVNKVEIDEDILAAPVATNGATEEVDKW
jgi:hypothetical protein